MKEGLTRHRPQWLWHRGPCKRAWIEHTSRTYALRPSLDKRDYVSDEDMHGLRKAINLSYLSWMVILGLTLLLLGVPNGPAFVTGFYTPEIGISCRAFTIMIYVITQLGQLVLWIWAYTGPLHEGTPSCGMLAGEGILRRHGFFDPTDISTLRSRKTFWRLKSLWPIIWYSLASIFGLGAVLSSIIGTTLQLMGTYSAPMCSIDAEWWLR